MAVRQIIQLLKSAEDIKDLAANLARLNHEKKVADDNVGENKILSIEFVDNQL